jgi:tetratricopeptide (TPR) repeat protein
MLKKVIGKVCRNSECEQKDKLREDFQTVCDCGQALEQVTATDKKKAALLVIVVLLLLAGGGYAGVMKLKIGVAKPAVDAVSTMGSHISGPINDQTAKASPALTQQAPSDPVAAMKLVSDGLNLAKEGKFDEAATVFQAAIQKDPNNNQAYGNLGAAYSALGKYDDAVTASTKAISINPKNEWHLNAAEAYSQKGDKTQALAQLRAAIDNGFKDRSQLRSFNFKAIENEPGFKELMGKL